MSDWKRRLAYLVCTAAVTSLGLASRRFGSALPVFVAEYAGDTLWALMVFLGISMLAPHVHVSRRGGMALAFAYAIEISQLYHAPWIDAVRSTLLGGLVLGFGFLWTDLVCYGVGILFGGAVDHFVLSKSRLRTLCDGTEET